MVLCRFLSYTDRLLSPRPAGISPQIYVKVGAQAQTWIKGVVSRLLECNASDVSLTVMHIGPSHDSGSVG